MIAAPEAGSSEGSEGSGGSGGSGSNSSGAGASQDAGPGDAGPSWTVPPGQTFSETICKEDGLLLFVEIWPDAGSACVPTPYVQGVLVMGIGGWDGKPGTFIVGVETPQGTARALFESGIDKVEGKITVEPFVGTPSGFSWDLSVGSGSTDLSTCGRFEVTSCVPSG
ncbi:hypothetical protein WMF04_32090 [Sorangium sp. So ce260]|uniref:hypothetical protein n=1 Tax=Sorangium sp. So ce260 TaxID=3133291 RepID=UPI003F62EA4A